MAQIDIKLQSVADVKGFTDAIKATKTLKTETEGLGSLLKEGLGIGGGIEIAHRALELFKETVIETARESFRMANEIHDGAEAVGVSTRAYQVLGEVMREAGGEQARMTQAIAASNRALVEARSLAGPAANAFRTLGLDSVALEGMTVQDRLAAIGRAVANATDKTEAFAAAGNILGSKNLPTLLSALKTLGTEGYDEIADKAEKAGRIMSDDTVERLHKAEIAIERWKHSMVIAAGETISAFQQIGDAFKSNSGGMFGAIMGALFTGNAAGIGAEVGQTLGGGEKKSAVEDPAILAAQAAAAQKVADNLNAIKNAETELARVKNAQALVEGPNTLDEETKRRWTIENLRKEFDIRKELIGLEGQRKLGDNETPQSREKKLGDMEQENRILAQKINLLSNPKLAFERANEAYAGINNPNVNQGYMTPGQGAIAGFENFMSRAGSLGQQVAAGIENTLGAAVNSISQGITGWIMGVQTFGQMMANIGRTILSTVLETIIQIGVRFVLNALLGKAIAAGAAAASIALAAQTAPILGAIWAGPATLATIASAGVNAAAAPFEIAAATAEVVGLGLFEKGGFTGQGGASDIAGLVHRGEYVIPAWMVNSPQFGPMLDSLEAARSGGISSLARPSFAPAGNGSPRINILLDPAEFARLQQEHSGDWFQQMHASAMRRNA